MKSVKARLFRLLRPRTRYKRWLPPNVYSDDVYLVSYPKSGNTWVRFLIANLLKKPDEEVIDFYTVQPYVPEVGTQDDLIALLERPRIIKSHAPYVPEFSRVIYIVRDARDVYVSYYLHRLSELPSGTAFQDFLSRTDHFPCLWGEHVSSWLHRIDQPNDMLLLRYEDLIADCEVQTRRISEFLHLEVDEKRLFSAVEASSFETMRQLERERGRPYKGPEHFVRKGKPGNWKEWFGPKEKAILKSREGAVLIEAGYETDNDW